MSECRWRRSGGLLQSTLRSAEHRGEIDLAGRRMSAPSTARLIDHAVQGVVSHALTELSAWPGELHRLIAVVTAGMAASPERAV